MIKFFFFIFTFLILVLTPTASAHVLSRDNTIGGVIHIDPEDNPIVAKNSAIYIDIKDTNNKFFGENCICTVNVTKNNQLLTTLSTNGDNQSLRTDYVFSEKGIYTLTLNARSTNNSFDPFSLDYTVRVEREEKVGKQSQDTAFELHTIHFISIAAVFIFFIILLVVNKLRETKTK